MHPALTLLRFLLLILVPQLLNCERQIAVGTSGPQPRAPSQRPCRRECQRICQKEWSNMIYNYIYMYIYIQYILLYTSRWYARIYVRMMCVDHSKKVIIYLIFVSFNYYTHFLYKHSDISRWMVWATAPRENGTQERSPRVSFDMGRPAQELSWNALRWRWGHTPSLGVQGMGFLGETRHVCFAGMCIYCILVYAYITAHYCTCTCTVHLHQIYKSICRYVYQHIW